MKEEDQNCGSEQTKYTTGRFLMFSIPLAMAAAIATVAVAILTAPDHLLAPEDFASWAVVPIGIYFAYISLNTTEGCIVLGILSIPLMLTKLHWSSSFFYPAATAVVMVWFTSRIFRRYFFDLPWIE